METITTKQEVQRWEYLVVGGGFKEERLNEYGKMGWELVAVLNGPFCFFKRPL